MASLLNDSFTKGSASWTCQEDFEAGNPIPWPATAVRELGLMPRSGLVSLLGDHASEPSDLWPAGLVLEILSELGEELDSEFGVVDRVDRPHNLLSDNRPSGSVVSGVR
jgi:hypothetical protein